MTIEEAKKLRRQQMIESFKNLRLQYVDNIKKASDTYRVFGIVKDAVNTYDKPLEKGDAKLFEEYKGDIDKTNAYCKDAIDKQSEALKRVDDLLELCKNDDKADAILSALIVLGKEIPIETTLKQAEEAEKRRAEAETKKAEEESADEKVEA